MRTNAIAKGVGIGCVVMLAYASVASGTSPWAVVTGDDGPKPPTVPGTPPPDFPTLVRTVAKRVEKIRGERFDHLPTVKLVTEAEMYELLKQVPNADHAPPKAKSVAVRSLVALDGTAPPRRPGINPPAGVYIPSAGLVLIQEDEFGNPYEPVIAHELTHALEDQNFGISETAKIGGSEASQGLRALVEGSASFVEKRYAHRFMDGQPSGTEMWDDLYRGHTKNPRVRVAFARGFLPYLAGEQFVARLYRRGGWDLVDEAFAHPPASTSAIAHPQSWLRGDPVTIPALPPPGPPTKWRFLGTGHFGEFDTNVFLHAELDSNAARRAAAGIEGGRYAVWRKRSAPYDCGIPCSSYTVATIAWRFSSWHQAEQFQRLAPNPLAQARATYLGHYVWSTPIGYAGIAGTGGPDSSATPTWAISFAPSQTLARRLALTSSTVAATSGRTVFPSFHP